jgi:hypothetical protein
MTDRELLELAAKAAGISYEFVNEVCIGKRIGSDGRDWPWNPLTDDGDALRLAVKLRMMVDIESGGFCTADIEGLHSSLNEVATPDPYAATRRAIVKAAAEIGKAMKGETT